MRISQAFPSNYIKAADLQGQVVRAVITDCQLEDLGGESKPVLRFQDKEKGMVLNKTNATTLADAFGDDTSGWRGKVIEIFSARVSFQGRMVDGLQVRAPTQPSQAVPAADPNDDLTF